MRRPWFGVKRYGFGVTPVSPEGWAVTAAFIVFCVTVAIASSQHLVPEPAVLLLVPAAMLALFVVIARTNDGKRWRIGEDD